MTENNFLLISGVSLFVATFSSFRFAFSLSRQESDTGQVSKKIKISFWLLFIYFASNFCFELVAWMFAEIPSPNHFIYSINYMIISPCLFLFFLFQNPDKKFGGLILFVYGIFVTLFIYYSLWNPSSILSFPFVVVYYSFSAVVSAVFLSFSLVKHQQHSNKANVGFGILFFIYHFFALLISVFMVNLNIRVILDSYLFFINTIFSISFYSISGFLFFRLKKTDYYDC